jgi:hypothetical protein
MPVFYSLAGLNAAMLSPLKLEELMRESRHNSFLVMNVGVRKLTHKRRVSTIYCTYRISPSFVKS